MPNKPLFYNSRNGDRKYNADDMTEWLTPFFTTGVFNNGCQVTAPGGMAVVFNPGYVNIGGKVKYFDGIERFDLEVASGTLSRIDIGVYRRDDINRDIYPMVITGAYSSNPQPPALVREGGIYDIQAAQWTVARGVITINQANITDTRMDPNLCGWVMATVKEIDFSQITAQFDNYFDLYIELVAERYAAYNASMGVNEQDAAQSLADFKSQLQVDLAGFKTEFLVWFDTIKGILGEDVAGQLAIEIQALQQRVTALEEIVQNMPHTTDEAFLGNCYLGSAYLSNKFGG